MSNREFALTLSMAVLIGLLAGARLESIGPRETGGYFDTSTPIERLSTTAKGCLPDPGYTDYRARK